MRKNVIVGIDIGTHTVKVVIARTSGGEKPIILGVGSAPTTGMRHGYITSQEDVSTSINEALEHAQRAAGTSVARAYVSIGGEGLSTLSTQGEAIVSRASSEVSEVDTENAMIDAEKQIAKELLNRKVLHAIPVTHLLDNKPVLGRLIGMRGSKVQVQALFITVLEQHLLDIIAAVEATGVEVVDVMASPIAASLLATNKQQKMAGCVLVDIGAETLSVAVFEENTPISLRIFPTGSADITNDIALSMQASLHDAEQLKTGAIVDQNLSQKKIEQIITARTKNFFGYVQEYLKEIEKAGLLPAGAILTGGGAHMPHLDEYARTLLKLPAEVARIRIEGNEIQHASWAVSYGLVVWGASAETETVGIASARAAGARIFSWVKKFLP